MSISKRATRDSLNARITPRHGIDELNKLKLQKLLEDHFPDDATDPRWVMKVASAIRDAHSRSSIAINYLGRASDQDVLAQLRRVVDSSNELLEALSGTYARGQQIRIADRLWFSLHSFWTLLYGPPEDGDFWQRDTRKSSELDRAFFLLRRLNQRSRRILRRYERANLGKEPTPAGIKADHYVHSFVMCLGRCSLFGGATDRMTDRQQSFITAYLKAAGRKHTTEASVRSLWNRVKDKDTEPCTQAEGDTA